MPSYDDIKQPVKHVKTIFSAQTGLIPDGEYQGKTEEVTVEEKPGVNITKERAAVVLIKCVGLVALAEANGVEPPAVTFFQNAPGAVPGRRGGVRLFPDYENSPVGIDRGGQAAYRLDEVIPWVIEHFPEVLDEIADATNSEHDEKSV